MNNIDYCNVDFPVKICTFKAKQIANTTCRVTKQRNFFETTIEISELSNLNVKIKEIFKLFL